MCKGEDGQMITFVFFGIHMELKPYKSTMLNTVKTVSETQLFVVLLCSTILQQHNVGFGMEIILKAIQRRGQRREVKVQWPRGDEQDG